MLDQNQAADLFARIRKYATADEVECYFYGGRSALTRFANNTIHQNVAEENYGVSVRTVFGGRTARATSNKLDDESLKRVVQASEALAKVQHPDSDLLPVAGSNGSPLPVVRHFAETAAITPELRADAVKRIVTVAEKDRLTTAGTFSNSASVEGIFNSAGLSRWHTQTSSEISVTMLASDSSGWQKANSPNVADLDGVRLANTAAAKARESASPKEVPPGKYTVILEPAAVLDMVGFLFFDFGGLSVLEQRSFLNNRIGTKLFGENITVWDDVSHPLQSGSPFDGEGVARRRVQLIEKGTVQRLVYGRATAEKMQKSEYKDAVGPVNPTGHGFLLPNEMGEAPMNIVFTTSGETKTVNEMIASTEKGLLVTRLWYIREVSPYEKVLTGMTRDGTFYILDGKVQHGIRNFRFNESLIHMLSNVAEMSVPGRASGEESFDMVVPAMKVQGFNFTEVTKF